MVGDGFGQMSGGAAGLMKLWIGLAAAIALIVAGLAGVVLVRTAQFGPNSNGQSTTALPEPPAFNLDAAAEAVGEAIRIRTVTLKGGDPQPGQEGPWLDLHAFLEGRYPQLFAASRIERGRKLHAAAAMDRHGPRSCSDYPDGAPGRGSGQSRDSR